jgi:hypothetical protein
VRAVGTAHSWSSYGAGEDLDSPSQSRRRLLCLDLSGLDAGPATVLATKSCRSDDDDDNDDDDDTGSAVAVVTVGAGALVSALARAALARGVGVRSLPLLHAQTVGGAVSVGSHGSSAREGTLSDQVDYFHL